MAGYYPLNTGDKWTWKHTRIYSGYQEEFEEKYYIAGPITIGGYTVIKMQDELSDYYMLWTNDSNGLRCWGDSEHIFSSPIKYANASAKVGDKITQTIDGQTVINEFVGVENVTVPAGTFQNCVKIKTTYPDKEVYRWLAKDVGQVKLYRTDINKTVIWELTYAVVNGVTYGSTTGDIEVHWKKKNKSKSTRRWW
jgi:hypothetical protein